MHKKILVAILALVIFVSAYQAKAWIVVPFFNINVTEHSIGSDGPLNLHITASRLIVV